MPLKDHYKTLGVSAGASPQDIKKAYRSLAHKYHPDKNQDNTHASDYFRSIHEAYSILSDERKKKQYDEERYFAGLSAQKEPERIDSVWILKQAKRLSAHMAHVDSYRMNHKALHDYVMLLLSNDHLAILRNEDDVARDEQIISEILHSTKNLAFIYFTDVMGALKTVANGNAHLEKMIANAATQRKKQSLSEKFLPLIILSIALLLCFIMYLYSLKR